MLENKFFLFEAVLKLLRSGGWVSKIDNKANSVQLQLGWCLGVILGSFLTPRAALAGVVTGTQVK